MAFAFLFFDSVGGGEWLVLLAVVLIVVGPKNLPSAARKLGQILTQLRRAADEFKRQIMTMDQEMERAVNDMKKDYINVAEEVDKAVTEDSGATDDADPGSEMGDGEDRAYDYYGEYGYDETGEMYSDTPPMLGEEQSGAEESETAGAAAPSEAEAAAPSGGEAAEMGPKSEMA